MVVTTFVCHGGSDDWVFWWTILGAIKKQSSYLSSLSSTFFFIMDHLGLVVQYVWLGVCVVLVICE